MEANRKEVGGFTLRVFISFVKGKKDIPSHFLLAQRLVGQSYEIINGDSRLFESPNEETFKWKWWRTLHLAFKEWGAPCDAPGSWKGSSIHFSSFNNPTLPVLIMRPTILPTHWLIFPLTNCYQISSWKALPFLFPGTPEFLSTDSQDLPAHGVLNCLWLIVTNGPQIPRSPHSFLPILSSTSDGFLGLSSQNQTKPVPKLLACLVFMLQAPGQWGRDGLQTACSWVVIVTFLNNVIQQR